MRAYEFIVENVISEDRESMLEYIRANSPDWDIDEFKAAFDRLCQHPEISFEWKEKMHNLIMKTATTYRLPVWDNEFKDDPDLGLLLREYAELAEQMRVWYVLNR